MRTWKRLSLYTKSLSLLLFRCLISSLIPSRIPNRPEDIRLIIGISILYYLFPGFVNHALIISRIITCRRVNVRRGDRYFRASAWSLCRSQNVASIGQAILISIASTYTHGIIQHVVKVRMVRTNRSPVIHDEVISLWLARATRTSTIIKSPHVLWLLH